MSEYKDAKGVVYDVQASYTDGEIVILSDDLAAWRVSSGVLCAASSVFSDMFASGTSGPKEIILSDTDRIDLHLFIGALCETLPRAWLVPYRLNRVIDLSIRYGCLAVAERTLYDNVQDVKAEDLFDCFVLASRLDCLRSACRILGQGYKWYATKPTPLGLPLCPTSDRRPWTAADAGRIQSSWAWALTGAAETCHHRPMAPSESHDRWSNPVFWRIVLGEFIYNITR